jgi:triosephosphate isomerase (TIM)
MRRPFVAGNWKMNLNRAQGTELASALASKAGKYADVEIAICPPNTYLEAVRGVLGRSTIGLGAQNCYYEAKGAFTGEVSPQMLVDVGCKYVILGHSERRHIFKESNQDVNKKVVAALGVGLTPIVCLGELLEERRAGKTLAIVTEQLDGSLTGLTAEQVGKIVIAYEPVWAIGTGIVATPEQAEEVHSDLRRLLQSRYNPQIASQVRIQYGGSVNAENATSLLSQPNIDGALVGGASLKADSFLGIIEAART